MINYLSPYFIIILNFQYTIQLYNNLILFIYIYILDYNILMKQ